MADGSPLSGKKNERPPVTELAPLFDQIPQLTAQHCVRRAATDIEPARHRLKIEVDGSFVWLY